MKKPVLFLLLLSVVVVLAGASRVTEQSDTTPPMVAAIPAQKLAIDHTAKGAPPRLGTASSSWQVVSGSGLGPLRVTAPSVLLVEVTSNYNWDGSLSWLYVQTALELSTDDAPFKRVLASSATQVANGGTDVVRRHVVHVKPGHHSLRLRHCFTVPGSEAKGLTRLWLTDATISVRTLPASAVPKGAK